MPKSIQNLFLTGVTFYSGFFATPSVCANVGEAYGFGSRTAALAGAGVAWGFEAYTAYGNPAALALPSEKRLHLSWGLLDMVPSFLPISDVVIENEYTSDKLTTGNVDVSYRSTLGQTLGLAYHAAPGFLNLSLGLSIFSPINQIAYLDTGESFIPEYVLYRSRTQRPQCDLGLGIEAASGLYFGLGAHVGYTLTSKATLFLQASSDKTSSMRFTGSLVPKAAPYFSLLFTPENSFSLGSVVRLAMNSSSQMTLEAGARTFGNLAALDFNFSSMSALYYDPLTVETGISWRYLTSARIYLQADFQAWSKFEEPSIAIQDPSTQRCDDGSSCGIKISKSNNPSFDFKNIWIPRVGHELELGNTTLRFGYAYRPSIIKSLPTEAGNYLDPVKHMWSVGAGFKFDHFLSFDTSYTLDIHASYHHLVKQIITKSPGNELGQGTTDIKIGAPGYEAGGKVYGGGLSLSWIF